MEECAKSENLIFELNVNRYERNPSNNTTSMRRCIDNKETYPRSIRCVNLDCYESNRVGYDNGYAKRVSEGSVGLVYRI